MSEGSEQQDGTRARGTPHPRVRVLAFALAVLTGVLLGGGVFTLVYAEGLSYASNDPEACVNCHIMREQFAGWQAGPHHAVATCNDCHVPHAPLSKYLAKALNGWHHSSAFTTAGLRGAHPHQAGQRPDPAGQLPALPRGARRRDQRALRQRRPGSAVRQVPRGRGARASGRGARGRSVTSRSPRRQ